VIRALRTLLIVIAVVAAGRAFACSCAPPMAQITLDRAEVLAEVRALGNGRFEVVRVVRGGDNVVPRVLRSRQTNIEPRHCCEQFPAAIAEGGTYFAMVPAETRGSRARLAWEDVAIIAPDDNRVAYLTGIREVEPADLRQLVRRWGEGAYAPREFENIVENLDVAGVPFCRRGAWRALLISLTFMAWGNDDHVTCNAAEAERVRPAAARAALDTMAALERGTVPLPCSGSTTLLPPAADPLERQIELANGQYPCTNPRKR
jgi:hypothetical protein